MSHNKYLEYFLNSRGNRDLIFNDTLNIFQSKPINILEIGAARSLDFYNRQGDGWSSLHYYQYIIKNGGTLTICDIDPKSISTCQELFANLETSNVKFVVEDGFKLINEHYDLIYLDGSDDPNDMVLQLNAINLSKQVVLCDDFHTKGSLAIKYHPNVIIYGWRDSGHRMGLYRPNYLRSEIYIKQIQ